MDISRRLELDGSFFVAAVSLIVILNLGQYAFGFGVMDADGWKLEFGFPFSYYDYLILLNRGRFLLLGMIGNLLFAFAIGLIVAIVVPGLKQLFRGSRLAA